MQVLHAIRYKLWIICEFEVSTRPWLEQSPAKSTMSDGNKMRGWQVFETLYYKLLSHYTRQLKKAQKTYNKRQNHKTY
jgi:hypothetical protein